MNQLPPLRNFKSSHHSVCLATFIVGCLVQADIIPFDEHISSWMEHLEVSIRVIAAILDQERADPENGMDLPFRY